MPTQIPWGKLGESNKRDSINDLAKGVHVVRFIGEPIEFYKYFVNGRSAVCSDPKNCPIKAKYGIKPTTRFAVNIIDRSDGTLKVLECSFSVLKPVSAWGNQSGRNPGGEDSVDFSIETTYRDKKRFYNIIVLKDAQLTVAEKKMIEETGGTSTGYDLKKLYKPVSENEIEAKLFGKA